MTIPDSADRIQFTLPQPTKYSVKSTIQHCCWKESLWKRQLRDLVRATGRPDELAVVNMNSVNLLNTKTRAVVAAFKDLSFAPTSLAAGCGYLAVGGQRSQVSIRCLESEWNTQISVGGSINNALCITQSPSSSTTSDANVYVCNNDESIKVIEVPSMRKVCELKMPFAVNNVQVSPDGQWLVTVGDSSQVLVYAIKDSAYGARSGIRYEKIAMIRGSEAAFSCAWNHLSNVFAVGFQDGIVRVWDRRFIVRDDQRESMACIHAAQKGSRASEACRSVKFSSDSSIDLLAFSEHLSVVSLVDCRNWMDRQSIRLAPPQSDVSITGLSFGNESKSLYVGLESSILGYEIDARKRRCFPSASLV